MVYNSHIITGGIKMNKIMLKITFTGALAVGSLVFPCINSYAATPEEAAAVARAYGYTEEQIQQAFNEYYNNPSEYPPEVIDQVIEGIKSAGNEIVSVVPSDPSAQNPVETQTTPASGSDVTSQGTSEKITLTAPDGSVFERISVKDFIALSYEQKMTYLSTFTEAQQQVIIDNLTPEEYRSLMKQLPNDQKLEVIDKLSDTVANLGMTISIEDVSDDAVKVAMKNQEGILVGVGTAGNTVENTGYDRRGVIAVSLMLVTASIIGIFAAVRRFFGKEAENG